MPTVVVNSFDVFRKSFINGAGFDLEYAASPAGAHLRALIYRTGTPDQSLDTVISEIPNVEVSGDGYTAGGVALANGTITDAGSGLWELDFDDPADWGVQASGFSDARRFIFAWDNGGAQATWNLVAYSADFGADKGNVAGPFSLALATGGFLSLPR